VSGASAGTVARVLRRPGPGRQSHYPDTSAHLWRKPWDKSGQNYDENAEFAP
jgi:hypothetical protein